VLGGVARPQLLVLVLERRVVLRVLGLQRLAPVGQLGGGGVVLGLLVLGELADLGLDVLRVLVRRRLRLHDIGIGVRADLGRVLVGLPPRLGRVVVRVVPGGGGVPVGLGARRVRVLVRVGSRRPVVVVRVALELGDLLLGELPHQPLTLRHRLGRGRVHGDSVQLVLGVQQLLLRAAQRLRQLSHLGDRFVAALRQVAQVEREARYSLVDLTRVVPAEDCVKTGDAEIRVGLAIGHVATL
jgi:hypothetical protein